jgi:hypothetical protein
MKIHTKFGLETVKGSDNWEHVGVYGMIILRWILRHQIWTVVLYSSGPGYGLVASSCGHANEPPGSIKGDQFLGQLSELLDSQGGFCYTALLNFLIYIKENSRSSPK